MRVPSEINATDIDLLPPALDQADKPTAELTVAGLTAFPWPEMCHSPMTDPCKTLTRGLVDTSDDATSRHRVTRPTYVPQTRQSRSPGGHDCLALPISLDPTTAGSIPVLRLDCAEDEAPCHLANSPSPSPQTAMAIVARQSLRGCQQESRHASKRIFRHAELSCVRNGRRYRRTTHRKGRGMRLEDVISVQQRHLIECLHVVTVSPKRYRC
ncbi:unnamed protein product [Protopolystoma xenopodis]|uniref:Uncharacterized protein n=1 Tax=Protopolystoma xenopodis TaxID=117903 RepID=A0A3S5A821_9PLAT|nr:unnamed protein product [Protopolystoma xenopodis]